MKKGKIEELWLCEDAKSYLLGNKIKTAGFVLLTISSIILVAGDDLVSKSFSTKTIRNNQEPGFLSGLFLDLWNKVEEKDEIGA